MKSIISIISILSLGLLIQCQAALVLYEAPVGADDILEGSSSGIEDLGKGLEVLGNSHEAPVGADDILEGSASGIEELGTGLEVLGTVHEELGTNFENVDTDIEVLSTNPEGLNISPTEESENVEEIHKEIEEIIPGEIEMIVRESNYMMEEEEEKMLEEVFPIEKIVEIDVEIVNEKEIYPDAEEILSEKIIEIVRKMENIREEIEEEQVEEKAILESILEEQKKVKFQPIQVFIDPPKDNTIRTESKGIKEFHEDKGSQFSLYLRPIYFVSVGVLTLIIFLLLTMLLMTLIKRVMLPKNTPKYRLVPDDGTPPKAWLP